MPRKSLRPPLLLVLALALGIVAATPVIVITFWMHGRAQAGVLQEARDKNQLLSENIATPVEEYLMAARNNLRLLADLQQRAPQLVGDAVRAQKYFLTVLYVPAHGRAQRWSQHAARPAATPLRVLLHALPETPMDPSGVMRVAGKPTIFFMQPEPKGALVGSLDLAPIRALCGRIHFGLRGHCAIADQDGRLVAHPNPAWVARTKDISGWPIVRAGLQGKTGVMTFYSPFIHAQMIAGFAAVPHFHWVVLTPQPLSELSARAHRLALHGAEAALLGLVAALALGAVLSLWLLRPISALVEGMKRIQGGDLRRSFRRQGWLVPLELEILRVHSARMASSVRAAMIFRDRVNDELEERVREATSELMEINSKLERQVLIDELTRLGNRRMLWNTVARLEQQTPPLDYLPVAVLLFDVDRFKRINDTYGHAIGDQLLVHVARMLARTIRDGDYVVRYAGDEFLVLLTRCDLATAQRRAEAMRRDIFTTPLETPVGSLLISMSIGVAGWNDALSRDHFIDLVASADKAMYESKRKGRNRVSLGGSE